MSFSNYSVDLQFDLDEALDYSSTTMMAKPSSSSSSSDDYVSDEDMINDDNNLISRIYLELPSVRVSNDSVCCVCMEGFESHHHNTAAKQLPCRHVYHPDCILTWLSSSHHSCPLCRHVILHDDHPTKALH